MHKAQTSLYFWFSHPALFYGICFLLGVSLSFTSYLLLIAPILYFGFVFFIASFSDKSREVFRFLLLGIMTFSTAFFYACSFCSLPLFPKEGLQGQGYIKIKSISLQKSFFGERWVYHCWLDFLEKNSTSTFTALPCVIVLPQKYSQQVNSRPPANQDYQLFGQLIKSEKGQLLFKIRANTPWIAIAQTWSLAEMRYHYKEAIKHWIQKKFVHTSSSQFIAGLMIGEFDDHIMRQEFMRFGLQHLLAISGFHFSLLTSFLYGISYLFVPFRLLRHLSILMCLTSYTFLLGTQPSVLRAWIMCCLHIVAQMFKKSPKGLNLLGIALLSLLIYDPFMCQNIGFQFSFGTTATILCLYPLLERKLQIILPKRALQAIIEHSFLQQHAYCLLVFLRKAIALTLAVSLFAIPLTLYHFHQFAYLSLFYNLFFPFLVSSSLYIFLAALCFAFIPPLALLLHQLNSYYTHFLLQLVVQFPSNNDLYLRITSIEEFWLVVYYTFLFAVGILYKKNEVSILLHLI